MIPVNLIPARRRRARAVRRRLRAWLAIGAVYGLGLALAWSSVALSGRAPADELDARLLRVAEAIASAETLSAELSTQLAAARRELAAVRSVTEHPDWSILLGLVARERTQDIVLSSFELSPTEPPAPQPTPPGAVTPVSSPGATPVAAPSSQGYILHLTGIGRQQRDVPRFILRLEQMGLFSRVTLLESRSRMLGESEVFGFRVECILSDAGGVP
jgi:Tfp pilus assembly protein PilN